MSRWSNFFRRNPQTTPETPLQRELREERERLQLLLLRKNRERLEGERAYDAVRPSQYWKQPGDSKSGNAVMDAARGGLRSFARHLDENHDLAIGVLDDLVKKTVGCGIQVTFTGKRADGKLHTAYNKALRDLWVEWTTAMPDTTRSLPWPWIENLMARTFFRDGEMLVQHVMGTGAFISHSSRVPYSIELIESDYLPYELNQASTSEQNRIVHGVEMNDWKQPVGYWVYKEHPGNIGMQAAGATRLLPEYKRLSADVVSHLKFVRRFDQVRGASIFHGVLRRLEDIKEYEESERIAARVAAALCAVITKNPDFQSAQYSAAGNRTMEFNPGMIFDQLNPGEDVKVLGSERPNTGLNDFRNAMMRAVASGTGTSYSGISRNYNGTYSSQRQELVETWVGYEVLREYLYGVFYRPIVERFISMAIAAGLISTTGVRKDSVFSVDFVGPKMPWIDPEKEVNADAKRVEANFASRRMVIRENQLDPDLVDEQIKDDPLHPQPQTPTASTAGAPAKPKAGAVSASTDAAA